MEAEFDGIAGEADFYKGGLSLSPKPGTFFGNGAVHHSANRKFSFHSRKFFLYNPRLS